VHALIAFFVASGTVAEAPRRIAFTFDDGPSHKTTPALLASLDRWGVQATFFVNGYRFAADSETGRLNREVLRAARGRGHEVGNHTFTHVPLRRLLPPQQREEIVRNEALLVETLGERPRLFRPPYGRQSVSSWRIAHERGYRVVLWDVSPLDHYLRNPIALRDRVLEEILRKGGGIVILHDTYPWTVAAFDLIMEGIARENCRLEGAGDTPYQIVTLDEILRPRAEPLRREQWRGSLAPSCAALAAREAAAGVAVSPTATGQPPEVSAPGPVPAPAPVPGRPWTGPSVGRPSPAASSPASSAAPQGPPTEAARARLSPR
jgi:peptidoglycan/xylan/chitin deacetylase (PgdA/CDA1 family)